MLPPMPSDSPMIAEVPTAGTLGSASSIAEETVTAARVTPVPVYVSSATADDAPQQMMQFGQHIMQFNARLSSLQTQMETTNAFVALDRSTAIQ